MNRETITCDVDGLRLVGTHHTPAPRNAPTPDTGVLFLNAGPAPRSGNSDLSVFTCERLASRGIQSFRFDLPGLGDSDGDSPLDLPAYWNSVVQGRNDRPTAALIDHLARSFHLKGLVVGGLCAGAVSAIRLAGAKVPNLAGLILLEPSFRTHLEITLPRRPGAPAPTTHNAPPKPSRLRRKIHRILGRLGLADLPPEANAPLIRSFRAALERGVPAIAVLAHGPTASAYLRIIDRRLSPPALERFTRITLDNTNHILTAGDAHAQTARAITEWINARFVRVAG